jgi:hypothetical protein
MRPGRRTFRLDTIARDDALLDALGDPEGERPEDDAIALALYEWRRDVDSVPFPAGSRRGFAARFRGRVGRGVATGAVASAIGLVSVGGVAAAATQAGPDSALWPITRVVAADRVQSREAAFHARSSLDRASTAAEQDRRDAAEQYLADAENDTVRVRPDDGGSELRDEAAQLRRRLQSPDAGGPASASPSPSDSPAPSEQPTWSPFPTPSGSPDPDGQTTGPRPTTEPQRTTEPSARTGRSAQPGRTAEPQRTTGPGRTAGPQPTTGPQRTTGPGRTAGPRRTAGPSRVAEPAPRPGLTDAARELLRLLLSPGARP